MPRKSLAELESMVGESKVVVEGMDVEAGKVAEFARALGIRDEVHYDPDAANQAGLERVPAPVTFLRTSVFPRHRPNGPDRDPAFELGFDHRREVHGEHSFEFERPVYVGDTLTGVATLADVYQRESSDGATMTFAVQELRYEDEAGDRVATERMTVIETPPSDGGRDDD